MHDAPSERVLRVLSRLVIIGVAVFGTPLAYCSVGARPQGS